MSIQRIRTNIKLGLLMAVMLAAPLMGSPLNASADTTASNTANTLKISPVRSDIQIEAGSSQVVKVVVSNLTSAPVLVQPIENDFISKDEAGSPSLILDEDQFAPTHSLKRFMTPLTNVTIPAKQSVVVEVTITVPKTAQAGGYFGAIRFAPASPDGGKQVNLSASVASLILLTVPGDVVEKLNMTSFSVQQNGKDGTYFQNPNNLQTSFRFENKGNIQEAPFGQISVKRGDKVVYTHDFNQAAPRDVVLPDGARRWNVPLKNIGKFGHYTVNATLTYGKKNQTVDVQQSFWVIPFVVIIGAIVGLLVLIGLIVAIVAFLRSYKKRIINSYGRGGGRRR